MLHQLLTLLPMSYHHPLQVFWIFQKLHYFYIFDDSNSRSISKPTNGKLKDLQKVIKYPNGATTSTSNLPLSAVVLPINTQQTFQRCFNVAFWLIRHGDVEQCHINVEATLNISKLGFATSNKISIKFQR